MDAAIKTAVITGGAGHLGRAIARWWANRAANIVIIDRDAGSLARVQAELSSTGANVITQPVDLAQPNALDEAVASLPASTLAGPLSLVLAHGVSGRTGPTAPRLGALQTESWNETLSINLTAAVFAIQTFVPFLKGSGGRVVLVESAAAGVAASPTAALSYAVSKAGVAALPALLAGELGAIGVLINAVSPGKFANPDWPDSPEQVERYAASVPLQRLAATDEVAELIGFLGSEANTYVTGQTIVQDGGRLSAAFRTPRP